MATENETHVSMTQERAGAYKIVLNVPWELLLYRITPTDYFSGYTNTPLSLHLRRFLRL